VLTGATGALAARIPTLSVNGRTETDTRGADGQPVVGSVAGAVVLRAGLGHLTRKVCVTADVVPGRDRDGVGWRMAAALRFAAGVGPSRSPA
jgi:hypothetical protein